jgi:hypothetical protein
MYFGAVQAATEASSGLSELDPERDDWIFAEALDHL